MFIALAREGHFGRAAERLNIAQPTLSAGIKQLEAQLGVQLVHRGSRFGGLTPEGQTALSRAKRILDDARHLREEMRISRQGLTGEVRLSVIPTAQTWAGRLCTLFAERHPNVHFTVLSRNSREILQMLDDFEADAGISYLDNEALGRVDTADLYDESYILVWVASVASGHCMTVLPKDVASFLSGGKDLALVPLSGASRQQKVGLIIPYRDPRTPVLSALLAEARKLPQAV